MLPFFCSSYHRQLPYARDCEICLDGYAQVTPVAPDEIRTCELGTSPTPLPVANCYIYKLSTSASPVPECAICKKGYVMINKKCEAFPGTVPDNCLQYDAAGACLQCNSKFYLNGAACSPVSPELSGCLYYGTSQTVCTGCDASVFPPAYLVGGACKQMTASNCMFLDSATECAYCAAGNDLDATTKQCTPSSQIDNCAS